MRVSTARALPAQPRKERIGVRCCGLSHSGEGRASKGQRSFEMVPGHMMGRVARCLELTAAWGGDTAVGGLPFNRSVGMESRKYTYS